MERPISSLWGVDVVSDLRLHIAHCNSGCASRRLLR